MNKNKQKYTNIYIYINKQKYAKLCKNMQKYKYKYTTIHQNMQKYKIKIFKNIQK